uniref:DUF2058 domain-containing protein n=1 Tax=Poseidonibacter lekithochrous TaxID=1904463 RepID=UPI0008FC2628
QKNEAAQAKEIAAQVKQLIEMNCIDRTKGEEGYNFTDCRTDKTLYVTPELRDQLIKGRLAIARLGEGYELIPAVVADKIAQRDQESIVVNNTVDETVVDEDDPYADFVIPDDLMW